MAANSATQLRFLATVKRQSAPPRCNPFAIVVQVLAMGLMFIGLTMTIIAHWPGSTSIGENPLKIAGPALLCVGIAAFFIGIVVVCLLNRRERRRWETTLARIAASAQQTVDPSLNPVAEEKTQASVAVETKKPLSTYIEAASVFPDHAEAGVAKTSGYADDNKDVPDAIRIKKPRRPKKTDTSGETSSSIEDLTVTTTQHSVVEETVVQSTKRVRPKPADVAAASVEESHGLLHDVSTGAVSGAASASGDSKRLHVHVKAQPGATVRIHQVAAPPPVAPKPAFSAHNRSAETDI